MSGVQASREEESMAAEDGDDKEKKDCRAALSCRLQLDKSLSAVVGLVCRAAGLVGHNQC